jgi:hypothetical protein
LGDASVEKFNKYGMKTSCKKAKVMTLLREKKGRLVKRMKDTHWKM